MIKQPALFRQEALAHKRDTWLGDILLSRPISLGLLAALALGVAVGVIAFLVWGEYTKKARASGYLVPDQGLVKIYAQQSGTVVSLRVKGSRFGGSPFFVSWESRGRVVDFCRFEAQQGRQAGAAGTQVRAWRPALRWRSTTSLEMSW